MAEIILSQGFVSHVDFEDYAYLQQWKWHVEISRTTKYAVRRARVKESAGSRIFRMHRVILGLSTGLDDCREVDHINGNGLDNRKTNLRVCATEDNRHNRKLDWRNTSGLKGVTWSNEHNKWLSRISVGGERYFLGYFCDKIQAAYAYDIKARELHGEFARLNFPDN
jgi:hypothetical protein